MVVVRVDVRMDMDLAHECGLLAGWREGVQMRRRLKMP